MGTAVDERVDSELTVLFENEDEVLCITEDAAATHSAVLECGHSFLVCDKHAQRCEAIRVIVGVAACWVCHKPVTLKSLIPL